MREGASPSVLQKSSIRRAALLACAALSASCASSRSLPRALSLEAPIEQRTAQYRRYRITHTEVRIYELPRTCGSYGCSTPPPDEQTLGRLADGTVVTDPVELAPLVASDSTTAQRARLARSLDAAGIAAYITAVPFGTVGPVLLFGGPSLGLRSDTALYVSVSMMVFAGLSAITGVVLREVAANSRSAAYRSFNGDFRQRLGLCAVPVPPAECAEPSNPVVNPLRTSAPTAPLVLGWSLRF